MRRHAKAASAGSTMRQSNGLGRIFCGAFVTHGASDDAAGSGAPIKTQRLSHTSKTLLGLAATLVTSLFLASPSFAATVTQRPLLFTFNGTASAGPLTDPQSIAIDNATGDVYIANNSYPKEGFISKFTASGVPANFSAMGTSSLRSEIQGSLLGIAVDNSGSANQGRLLFSDFGGSKLKSFAPSGELQWSLVNSAGQGRDVTVDASGHPWAVDGGTTTEYANTGTPPGSGSSLSAGGTKVEVDANGNVYVLQFGGELRKYVGGVFSSALDPNAEDVYADQSSTSGHIFTVDRVHNEFQEFQVDATSGQFRLSLGGDQTADLPLQATYQEVTAALEALPSIGTGNVQAGEFGGNRYYIEFKNFLGGSNVEQVTCEDGTTPLSGGTGCSVSTTTQGAASNFEEYEANGTHLGTFGTEYLSAGSGIAYNPSLDRVYVLEHGAKPAVSVFGPTTTGTVADTTIEDPSAIGVSSAHFSGTVNPQGTSSEWHFEWRKQGQSWAEGGSSPAQSLPVDSSDHTVEYTTNTLRGNTSYQVRLVAVNTANQLLGISPAKLFTTTAAAQAPAVTIAAPSQITVHAAKITGTVNPQGDTADWRVQTSTDPACANGFEDQPLQEISTGSASPINVEYEVTGLLPAEHYCARIVATNSAGDTTSETKEFETLPVISTQVFTAYAAPRTDTTARLNGFVNPEGSEADYWFEYSVDGTSWTDLPTLHTERVRRQIVVSEELEGLQPATTYHYKLLVENEAGLVEGAEDTFTTRTIAEMQLPARGIELVNQPDKGNQNLLPNGSSEVVSSDGETALWEVAAGAPGGNSGTNVNFLATRTTNGWVSRALIPPADQQIGGGAYTYALSAMTPDLKHFVLRAVLPGALVDAGPPTFVKLDDEQHQEVLAPFTKTFGGDSYYRLVDVTSDGAHVLMINPETSELEEVGEHPELISVMPDGTPSECGVGFAGSVGQANSANPPSIQWRSNYHRMSNPEASRVYFQAVPNGIPCESFQWALYYRDRGSQQTIEVDDGAADPKTAMIRATPDGKKIFFVTGVSHSPEDTNEAGDIYSWEAESGEYNCLTCVVSNPGLANLEDAYRAILVSDDFSHVYFASTKQLVPGYGRDNETNLYVLSDGTIKFIATMQSADRAAQFLSFAKISRDGNVLLFSPESQKSNTGEPLRYTTDRLACQSEEGGSCDELYRYEDSTDSLECVSCLHSGVNTKSANGVSAARMTADGSTIAFSTQQALVPDDINGTYDVYEWHNGAVGLITDGETVFPSTFKVSPSAYGIDATGKNIFFSLIDPGLTGYEGDSTVNLYDARVGGGFPRPSPVAHCSEESCQGQLQSPPTRGNVGSAAAGAGNVRSEGTRRCGGRRGKARRRCLHGHKHRRHDRKASRHRRLTQTRGGAK